MNWEETIVKLTDQLQEKDPNVVRTTINSIRKVSRRKEIPNATILNILEVMQEGIMTVNWEAEQTLIALTQTQAFSLEIFQKLFDLLQQNITADHAAKVLGKSYRETMPGEDPSIPSEIMQQINELTANYDSEFCGSGAETQGLLAKEGMSLSDEQVQAISGILSSVMRIAYPKALIAIGYLDQNQPPIPSEDITKILELTSDVDAVIQQAAARTIGILADIGKQTLP